MADTHTASPLAQAPCGIGCDTPRHQPRNTGEALVCMRETLEDLYARGDGRAIFLRAYYIMTAQVNAAVHGGNEDFARPIFFDPEWVDRLAGRFAGRYFQSLDAPASEAWAIAMERARQRRPSILQCLMLGINAHINYDLSLCLHDILVEEGDALDEALMARRKFDHDQMNNVLARTNPKLQEILAREFGGGMRLFSEVLGRFDELLTSTGLRYYRDRVWCNMLGLLAARSPEEYEMARLRLEWESRQVAEFITDGSWLNTLMYGVDGWLYRRDFRKGFQPDGAGDVHAGGRMGHRLQRPH